ncbi:MAG TPA: hypothetical protein VI873_01445 [Candidatus Peribacteraceae bacterium]|nr:hypothetical protein [Candidatus Peribacteraceae bacterium]
MPIEDGKYVSEHEKQVREDAAKASEKVGRGGYSTAEHAAASCGRYNGTDIEAFRNEFNKRLNK